MLVWLLLGFHHHHHHLILKHIKISKSTQIMAGTTVGITNCAYGCPYGFVCLMFIVEF